MENLKHPHIAQHIVCPELEAQIKAAFERNIQNGTDYTVSRFRQALDSYVSTLISTPKYSSIVDNNQADIKSHFCRGRKWVTIDSNHQEQFDLAMKTATDNGLDELIALFEKNNSVHARFHSSKNGLINFSLHPNSSEASNIKFSVPTDIGIEFNVLDGTPKSCGLEGDMPKKEKVKKAKVQVKEIKQNIETEDNIIEEQEQFQAKDLPSDEELIDNETSLEDWENLLKSEGIDLDFDEESFDSYDEELHV